jgi:hypothetical protein
MSQCSRALFSWEMALWLLWKKAIVSQPILIVCVKGINNILDNQIDPMTYVRHNNNSAIFIVDKLPGSQSVASTV